MSRLVVVIQCDIVCKRCSGYACTRTFYKREGKFAGYPEDTEYMTMTCGGCCGMGVAAKLENLTRKLHLGGHKKEDVVVHLASCVVSDNYHNPACPHKEYIKKIVERKGYPLVLGSYISKKASRLREEKVYQEF